jgi:hypothetical protein
MQDNGQVVAYVYHRRPLDLRGMVLHPLSRLREAFPEIYAAELSKYNGREELLRSRIPPLDMGWADVLHCAPIHPHHIYQALRAVGLNPKDRAYFAIPVARLRGLPVAVLLQEEPDRYERFDERRYRELTTLPERTLRYYAEEARAGRRPLLYGWVPHVLVGASLSTVGLAELSWRSP